jgi:Zn-dependent protease
MRYVNPKLPYKTYNIFGFKTSQIELFDLFKAWIAISIAFGIILTKIYGGASSVSNFLLYLSLSGFTVGSAFILHEMGHKITAQRYGLVAEFRSFDFMLLLAIAMSFLGFVIAAPGAVMIAGKVEKNKYGKIAAAGPAMNIILAAMFGIAMFVTGIKALKYGFLINAFIALFNMLPFGAFDGKKILRWNRAVYAAMVVVSFTGVYLAF